MHKLIILDVLRFTLFKERMCNYFSLTKIIFAIRIYLTPEFFCIKGRFLSEQIFHEGVTMNILWKFPFFCIEPWKSTFFPTTFALLSWIFMESQYPQQGVTEESIFGQIKLTPSCTSKGLVSKTFLRHP